MAGSTYRVEEFLGMERAGHKKIPRWAMRARSLPWEAAKAAWEGLRRGRVLREPDGLEVARKMREYSWVLTSALT